MFPSPKRGRRSALVAALALVGLKFLGYFVTGSAAIFSDAMESVVNVAAAVLAIWALYLSTYRPIANIPTGMAKSNLSPRDSRAG